MKNQFSLSGTVVYRVLDRWFIILAVAIFCVSWVASSPVGAQTKQMPKPIYYAGFSSHYQGDYKNSLQTFRSAHRSAFRIGDKRYVDSVCSLTMMGECYFQTGDYAAALQHYNQALELYLVHDGQQWQNSIKVPTTIRPSTNAVQRAGVTWGTSNRRTQVADLPDVLSVLRGRVDAGRVWQEGGSFDPAEIRSVNVTEIMRSLALAIRRRGMINGPAGKYDALSLRAVGALKSRNAGNGSYLGALNGVVYGVALAAVGADDKAMPILQASLQLSGGMDHPLTSLALVQMAEIALASGQSQKAVLLGLEASYSSAWFSNFDLVEEALGIATQAHLYTSPSVFPPLANAIAWADRQRADMLQASLQVRLAECLSESGDFNRSSDLLGQTNRLIGRRNSLDQSIITSRLKYLSALNEFLTGNNQLGLKRLKDAMAHLQTTSRQQFRLRTADRLVVSGSLTEKQADALYELTLQDPSDHQWRLDPMEAIAFLVSPHVDALQRWFTIVVNRKATTRALQIADAIRRHRFFSALPLGGRLMAMRWVLHGETALLSSNALAQRQQFLARYTDYRRLLNGATTIKSELQALPLQPPTDSEDYATQKKLVTDLVRVSTAQEAMLASLALRRVPAELAFPPRLNPERIGSELQPGQLALVTLQTADGYHIFSIDGQRTRYLGLVSANAVKRRLIKIFAAMGVASKLASTQTLASEAWKSEIAQLQDRLLEDIEPRQLAQTNELIVIPDGLFWYLPIEAFFMDLKEQDVTFGEALSIRYCPTLALAFSKPVPLNRTGKTGVVTGPLYPQADMGAVKKYGDSWVEANASGESISSKIIYPSAYFAWQVDQLLTLQMDQSKGGRFNIKPMAVDTARFGTTLFDWMGLPEWAPHTLVLPGLNSVGGVTGRFGADGTDMFLTTTALMASGTRSILAARWNTGGQMQMEFAGRFATGSRTQSTLDAIKQTIAEVRELTVNATNEPRLNFDDRAIELNGDHPLFWSGQILIALPETDGPFPLAIAEDNTDRIMANDDDDEALVTLPGQDSLPEVGAIEREAVPLKEPAVQMGNSSSQGNESSQTPDVVSQQEDDEDDEGAVWQIGGKKKTK